MISDRTLSTPANGSATASRVSEVLRGKRVLSMAMVRRLRARFHVSADLLIPLEQPSTRKQAA